MFWPRSTDVVWKGGGGRGGNMNVGWAIGVVLGVLDFHRLCCENAETLL